jgi:hypothetical protein
VTLAEPEVVVEPRQAGLIAELGRELRDPRPNLPAVGISPVETLPADVRTTPVPTLPASDVPKYAVAWETVAGEWPPRHQSVLTNER